MTDPTIQLLSFKGCPLGLRRPRVELKEALAELGIPNYQEIDILDPATPEDLRRWASPTILVDGMDVSGGGPAEQRRMPHAGLYSVYGNHRRDHTRSHLTFESEEQLEQDRVPQTR